jgi:hypothetical protein
VQPPLTGRPNCRRWIRLSRSPRRRTRLRRRGRLLPRRPPPVPRPARRRDRRASRGPAASGAPTLVRRGERPVPTDECGRVSRDDVRRCGGLDAGGLQACRRPFDPLRGCGMVAASIAGGSQRRSYIIVKFSASKRQSGKPSAARPVMARGPAGDFLCSPPPSTRLSHGECIDLDQISPPAMIWQPRDRDRRWRFARRPTVVARTRRSSPSQTRNCPRVTFLGVPSIEARVPVEDLPTLFPLATHSRIDADSQTAMSG